MARTYHITTFGCRVNQADTELVEGIMSARGWLRADGEESAGVILYNTCVVREHAEERALARLSQLKRLKAADPDRIVGVTGCMARKDAGSLPAKPPHLDAFAGRVWRKLTGGGIRP